jgi:phospholipase/lecithinase/hemolysin
MPSLPLRYFFVIPFFALIVSSAQATSINAIYAFGDSLSDAGNVYAATGVPAAPYVNGHFTNGQVWVQDLAASLNLGPVTASLTGGTDYAVGGALSGNLPFYTATTGDLPWQLAAFQAAHPSANPNGLYTIWIGANDLNAIFATNPTSAQAAQDVAAIVGNIDSAIGTLAGEGAKNFLVVTVPDLGKTPDAIAGGPAAQVAASALSAEFDTLLVNGNSGVGIPSLAGIAAVDSLQLNVLDAYSLLDTVAAEPGQFGFTNVTQPCLTGEVNFSGGTVCSNPNQYLFWDGLHPTAAGQAIVAEDAFALVTPEPGTVTLMGMGVVGLLAIWRRRHLARAV